MAALCSYQTLTRYDDCSRKSRARTLDDIRIKERETLNLIRSHTRNLIMIQNRRTLTEYVSGDDDDTDEYTPYSPPGTDEPDFVPYQGGSQALYQHDSPFSTPATTTSWDDTPSSQNPWLSQSPSPAWSSSCTSSAADTYLPTSSTGLLPSCLFELPEAARKSASPASSSSSSSTCHNDNLSTRQVSYKQCGKRQNNRCKLVRDTEQIHRSLLELQQNLSACNGDPLATSNVIYAQWQLIIDAMKVFERDIVDEAFRLITSLLENNLVMPQTVLHMLQHGLIFSLKDSVGMSEDGPIPAVKLLKSIARSTPSAIPYMIDLIYRSKLLDEFSSFISTGDRHEAQIIVEFFYFITETAMQQICQRIHLEPLIPDVLRATGVSKDTIESYSPVATMEKCFSSSLITNSIATSLSRSNLSNGDLVSTTFLLLANALKLVHILSASEEVLPSHLEWVVTTLCCFRDSGIEGRLTLVANGLERKIQAAQSSEHCSQGVGVDKIALDTLNQCRQFTTFYQQYYGTLSSNFANLMNKIAPASPVKNGAWSL